MPYATTQDLDAIADELGLQGGSLDAGKLLARAEHDVDSVIGPRAINATTDLKYDPATLPAAQANALKRAICLQAIYREQEGEEAMLGGDDFAPENLQVLRRASRISPAAIAELGGTGLIVYSGTVSTSATS